MGYNVARNPIGTVPNALLASDPSKELHPPKLSTIEIHEGQVKKDIFITMLSNEEQEDPQKWFKIIISLNACLKVILYKEENPFLDKNK